LKVPANGAGAFESIMTHIEEILSVEYALGSIGRAIPAAVRPRQTEIRTA
jgi:hypothetical protein